MFIQPFSANITITQNVCEGKWDNVFITTVQKIAIYLIIPIALIVFFEAVVKNIFFVNLANFVVTIVNTVHDTFALKLKDLYDRSWN